jgi:protoporphyrinogen/coproporphyrinogen III oxidase
MAPPSSPSSPHVVVIGAGVAGLAAARYLSQAGLRVTVLERNPHIGGRMCTDIENGFAIDTATGFLANFYTHTLHVIHELELTHEMVPIQKGGVWFADAQAQRSRPSIPHLSLHSKLTLCKLLYPLLRHWRALDIHAFHKAHRLDTASVTEYVLQRLNEDVLEELVQPLLSSIFYWTPEQTSQAMLFLLLKASLGMCRFTLRQGTGQLPLAMAGGLDIVTNSDVQRVFTTPSGAYTVLTREAGNLRHRDADGIVCAIPSPAVTDLFTELNDTQRTFFQSISYSSTVLATIALTRRISPNLHNLLVRRRDVDLHYLTAVTSLAAKNPDQVPTGCDLFKLSASGSASRTLLTQDDPAIRDNLVADLQKVGLSYDRRRDELFYRVYRWEQALPLFDVGHFRRLKSFANGDIESGAVVYAGDYLGGPFVEGAMTSGLEAGKRLYRRLTANVIPPQHL